MNCFPEKNSKKLYCYFLQDKIAFSRYSRCFEFEIQNSGALKKIILFLLRFHEMLLSVHDSFQDS